MEIQIIYEDSDFIILNKPSGVAVRSSSNRIISLKKVTESLKKQELYVVHRIDVPVSGVLVYAKNEEAANYYSSLIRKSKIEKKYIAVVKKQPSQNEATIEHYLKRDGKQRKAIITSSDDPEAKESILSYSLLGSTDYYHFLDVSLVTGRFHQIRAQLAAIGSPIKGDVKYGARRKNKDRSIHLHAYQLTFPRDKYSKLHLQAKPPKESLWNALGEINPLLLQDKYELWKSKI